MIIHRPTQTQVGREIQISARIELRSKKRGVPAELWFRFSENARPLISSDFDPFVVSLLLVAMQNNEPLEIRGPISQKLFCGLNEYQKIYHSWYPERFKVIEIKPESFRRDQAIKNKLEACAFSGGVDSFYTFLSKPGLSHAIFMAGFDMPLNLGQSIRELTDSYSVMMREAKVDFITGSTNIRNFVNSVDWTNAHGQALAATALFFKNSWSRFYIPSSYTESSYPKWGSHPAIDHLLSTESMEMAHHGANANRVKKLETVSRAKESYGRLRVCWIQDIGLKNCGQCEKCVRTMVALDILGALPRYQTFGNATKLNRSTVRKLKLRTYQSRLFARELMTEAVRRKKFGAFIDLGCSLLRRQFDRARQNR